jgi:glycosyltransferase involved in cell wall biosynthesis
MSTDDPIRIILLLMIKNESRIIRRSILSALPVVDAVCVSDTGSTDDTVQILEAFYPTLSVPSKTYQHTWSNFGQNRTLSFQDAQAFCQQLGWNPARTYALAIDADMELQVESAFHKQGDLGLKGYSLVQKAGTLHYANTRLMRLDEPWTCIGATHEYWNGPMEGILSDSKLWIDDKNDGGCKADKYTRDRTLLERELEEQPTNVRTAFYLAQTYKCLGLPDLSIEAYKKRIAMGGWFEEVWYSHYMIAQQYLQTGRPEEAELWVLKGQKAASYRSEALCLLVKHFRIVGQQWKAMHYYRAAKAIPKPQVALFLESEVYDHLLDYENTILQFYVAQTPKNEGLRASIRYLLKEPSAPLLDNVLSNLEFYSKPLTSGGGTPFPTLDSWEEYRPSSVSQVQHQGTPVTNVRYVNYHTTERGEYHSRDPSGIVRTRNYHLESGTWVDESDLTHQPTHIRGLEDIRLFSDQDRITYTAASPSASKDGLYRIVYGTYDASENVLVNSRVLEPPEGVQSGCEKNWLQIPSANSSNRSNSSPLFVYTWSPLRIGTVTDTCPFLHVTHTIPTPPLFQRLRGSANGFLHEDRIWCLTHFVKYGAPRQYYHLFVLLNKDTYQPEQVSFPFCFQIHGIEYCLSASIEGSHLTFLFSTFDANPLSLKASIADLEFISL